MNDNNQLEITGIGYFISSPNKIRRKIARYTKSYENVFNLSKVEQDEVKRQKYEQYATGIKESIELLNKRLLYHESRLEGTSSGSIQQSRGETVD